MNKKIKDEKEEGNNTWIEDIQRINNIRDKGAKEASLETNLYSQQSQTTSQYLGDIIIFEHINSHGIKPYDESVKLTNNVGILEKIEVWMCSMVET